MCKAIEIKAKARQPVHREAPKGQVRTTDNVCRRCLYHTVIGAGEKHIACVYADRAHHCRTLDPDYVRGFCKYFTKGKRKTGESFTSSWRYLQER